MKADGPPTPEADLLIVDDTLANLKLLSELLRRRGYKVRAVPSGTMALTAISASPPDLILLDIRMPDMDGYQVCERLKELDCAKDIPVIFISALDDTADKVKAFTTGGVDYVGKPFEEEEVLARVENHLAISRLQNQLAQRNNELQASLRSLKEKQAEVLALQRREILREERERIMRDMHDGIGGLLVSTLAMLEAGETDLRRVESTLRSALDDLRLVIDSLDPLEDNQLTYALGMFRARILPRLQASGLAVDWPIIDLPQVQDFGPHKVLQVMRLLQEAITNVIKHAKASKLSLRTFCEDSLEHNPRVMIEVLDDGKGLADQNATGRGIINMRRRAEALGGTLDITDTGNGVKLQLALPWECQQ